MASREPTREEGIAIYRTMHRIREFELQVSRCFAAAEIPGFIHVGVGEEAIAATVGTILEPADFVSATHRGHGHCLAKGADAGRMMAELFGRATGHCGGRGGSMHLCDMPNGVLGTNGIVGGNLPIAVGTALASKVRRTRQVTVAFFGDGAANEGAVHEAFNLACVWDLPVVFVCENNLYAALTPQSVHTKGTAIAERAAGYAMRGVRVDGNDVLAVFVAASTAIDSARAGEGPTLIEAMTYRWHGHHEGDRMAYRTKDEMNAWREKDPIPRFRAWLQARDYLGPAEDARLVADVKAEIDAATEFARQSPWPAPEAALEDVYA
jgi:TPP-dependent pyruvate/acetoin dehydrogenase alpha subunit